MISRRLAHLALLGLFLSSLFGSLTLGSWPQKAQAQGSGGTIKYTDPGVSAGSGSFAAADPAVDQYKAWFKTAPTGLAINFPRDPTKDRGKRPEITIPADAATKRPKIVFKLDFFRGEGTGGTLNTDWYIFNAYQIDEKTSRGIRNSNLFLLINDETGGESAIVYSKQASPTLLVNTGQHTLLAGSDRDASTLVKRQGANSIEELVRYTFNAPKDGADNCYNVDRSQLIITGPIGTGAGAGDAAVEKLPDSVANPLGLNGNCVNLRSTGWLAFWGVSSDSDPVESECSLTTLLTFGIGQAITTVIVCFVSSIIHTAMTPISFALDEVVKRTELLPTTLADRTSPLISAWQAARNIINVVVILALLAIAFANILHLNINTYAAKKALPNLVVGVIGANASILIIRFLVDVTQALNNWAVSIGMEGGSGSVGQLVTDEFVSTLTRPVYDFVQNSSSLLALVTSPFVVVSMIILIAFFFFLMFILLFVLLKRLIYLYVLIAAAPLAFTAYGVPTMQHWFSKWWDTFSRQLFVLPILLFAIAFVVRFAESFTSSGGSGVVEGAFFNVESLIAAIIIYGLALAVVTVPGKITKGVLDIEKATKKAFGMAQVAPQSMMSTGSAWMDRGKNLPAGHWRNNLYKGLKPVTQSGVGRSIRAAGTIVANPKIFQESYEARMKQGKKDREFEARTKSTGDVFGTVPKGFQAPIGAWGVNIKTPGYDRVGSFMDVSLTSRLSGIRASPDEALERNGKKANSYNSVAELNQYLTGDVYSGVDATGKPIPKAGLKALALQKHRIYEAIRAYETAKGPEEAQKFIIKMASARGVDDIEKIYKELNDNEAYRDAAGDNLGALSVEALTRVTTGYSRASAIARRKPADADYWNKVRNFVELPDAKEEPPPPPAAPPHPGIAHVTAGYTPATPGPATPPPPAGQAYWYPPGIAPGTGPMVLGPEHPPVDEPDDMAGAYEGSAGRISGGVRRIVGTKDGYKVISGASPSATVDSAALTAAVSTLHDRYDESDPLKAEVLEKLSESLDAFNDVPDRISGALKEELGGFANEVAKAHGRTTPFSPKEFQQILSPVINGLVGTNKKSLASRMKELTSGNSQMVEEIKKLSFTTPDITVTASTANPVSPAVTQNITQNIQAAASASIQPSVNVPPASPAVAKNPATSVEPVPANPLPTPPPNPDIPSPTEPSDAPVPPTSPDQPNS